MSGWTPEELRAVGQAEELQVASRRADGSTSPYVTIWVVRAGDDLYIRSARGVNSWFRNATDRGAGHIRAGGVARDVTFAEPAPGVTPHDIDAAYHAKYDRYGPSIVGGVVGAGAAARTVRLLPR
ncbi:DUF2255 family protein [Nocardia sp. 2YAB30]|uniref:DUF2255 family protein n=1 Tax=Nocardia sp. 2YAB30 TaxID=3233022 RepID=UPI003F9ACB03